MPKRLSEYSFQDFIHLRPLTHACKTWRYRRIDSQYFRQPAVTGNERAVASSIPRCNVVVTVAFNDAHVLRWHTTLTGCYLDNVVRIVCDNSTDDHAAREIARVCRVNGIHYLRLPPNPWSRKNPSRSHGLAMNWVWHRVLRPGRPASFGFLDHDLFPLARCNPFLPLEKLDFYGDKRWADGRWYLWAGYCFFRYDAVSSAGLDFGLDWFIGLDTGGANWDVLYRNTDPATLPDREIRVLPALPGVPTRDAYFERRDCWLHEVGLAGRPELRVAKRSALEAILRPHLGDLVTDKTASSESFAIVAE